MGSYQSVSEKRVGEIRDYYDIEVFTWIIPNVSSLLEYSVGDSVQSPPFSCFGASWILKIFPCGQTGEYGIVERLYSSIEMHHLNFKVRFRKMFGVENVLGFGNGWFCPGLTLHKINCHEELTQLNLKELYKKGLFEPNDSLILVLEVMNLFESRNSQDFHTESVQSAVGEIDAANGNAGIGEVFKEYLDFKNFTWLVWDMPSYQLPPNFEAQSPPFTFAKATWVLKIYPYYRMKPRNCSFDVVLQRLHSEIEEHIVKYKIILEYPDRKVTEQAFIFNNSCTKGDAIHFKLVAGCIPDMDKICFEIQMEMKNDVGLKFDSQAELIKLDLGEASISESSIVPYVKNKKYASAQIEDCEDTINGLAAA